MYKSVITPENLVYETTLINILIFNKPYSYIWVQNMHRPKAPKNFSSIIFIGEKISMWE